MSPCRITALALAGIAALSLPAGAASQRRGSAAPDPQSAMVEKLNEESLQRARQGLNSPTPGPDTTSNLNRMSGEDARKGRATPRPPMPFR